MNFRQVPPALFVTRATAAAGADAVCGQGGGSRVLLLLLLLLELGGPL
jgi:hypothetical protein